MSERDPTASIDVSHVLDCLPGPAVVIGEDHRIVWASRSYREAFADGADVVGRFCYEV